MEKTDYKVVETEEIIHRFYCDECGAFIKESVEYDDGWYDEPESGWIICHLSLKGHYCNKCIDEKKSKAIKYLKELGFDIKG